MVESKFFLHYVISYILHPSSATDEKQGNNYSSTILWASQHQPNVLATHVFRKTLHISWINGSKFCPSSDVREAEVSGAEASSVCFIPAESFPSTEQFSTD